MICFLSLPALYAVQCLMDMPTAVESFTLTCRAHSFFPEGIKLFRYKDDELLSDGSFTDAEVKGSLAHGDKNVMQRKPNSIYTTTECSSLLTPLHIQRVLQGNSILSVYKATLLSCVLWAACLCFPLCSP